LDPHVRYRDGCYPRGKDARAARTNATAADLGPLPPAAIERIGILYEERVKPLVHQRS
jgi:hypothetical protein